MTYGELRLFLCLDFPIDFVDGQILALCLVCVLWVYFSCLWNVINIVEQCDNEKRLKPGLGSSAQNVTLLVSIDHCPTPVSLNMHLFIEFQVK